MEVRKSSNQVVSYNLAVITAGDCELIMAAENKPDDLMVVYTTDDANYAELLHNAVNAQGIKCAIDGELQAGLAGIGTMEIKLLVRAEDYDRTRQFVKSMESRSS